MRLFPLFALALSASAVAGCDQLFPELTGANNDFSMVSDAATDGGSGTLVGKACVLGDLRAPMTCVAAAAGRHVTIEETRASADVGPDGSFTISLTGIDAQATLAVSDGVGSSNTTPTVSVLSGAALNTARTQGVALPVVSAATMSAWTLASGAVADPTRGAILAWVLDGSGAAVKGASTPFFPGATGPLYDIAGSGSLEASNATGTYGALGFLDLPAGTATLAITAPASSALKNNTFTLPVRGGAVTVSVLQLSL